MADSSKDRSYFTWALIGILCGLVGWLATAKDTSVLNSIKALTEQHEKGLTETRQSDKEIIGSLARVCDRLGTVEGRVSNLEIFIQMPYMQRQKLFESFKLQSNGKEGK